MRWFKRLIAVLVLLVAAFLAWPLFRAGPDAAAANPDLDVYRDQLAEVDRDEARGIIDAEDAERIKGRTSADTSRVLGIRGRAEMIHRDDLVIGAAPAD